jgi:hypothetical protein
VEIIAEILVALVQFLGETILQFLASTSAELGWHSVREAIHSSQPPRRIQGLIGFGIMGGAFGGLSLLAFPKHYALNLALRLATMLLGPLVSASGLILLARALPRYFEAVPTRWRWGNAFIFALAFALVRFAYAR